MSFAALLRTRKRRGFAGCCARAPGSLGAESPAAVMMVADGHADPVLGRSVRVRVAEAGALKRVGRERACGRGCWACSRCGWLRERADATAAQGGGRQRGGLHRHAARLAFEREFRAMAASELLPLLRDALRDVLSLQLSEKSNAP